MSEKIIGTFYVSGPMTGIEKFNFPAFEKAAATLRALGYAVRSAHEVKHDEPEGKGSLAWEEYLRGDLIAMLSHCNVVLVLPGWTDSRGAKLEVHVAEALGMPIYTLDDEGNIERLK